MIPTAPLLVTGLLSLALPQATPAQQPVRLHIFTQKTDQAGLVAPDYKDRLDSVSDIRAGLYSGREVKFTPVTKAEDAQIVVEILGREADPKDDEMRTVRAKVTAGPHVRTFEGRDNDGSWRSAAGDAAKQIRKWVAANYALFTTPQKTQ